MARSWLKLRGEKCGFMNRGGCKDCPIREWFENPRRNTKNCCSSGVGAGRIVLKVRENVCFEENYYRRKSHLIPDEGIDEDYSYETLQIPMEGFAWQFKIKENRNIWWIIWDFKRVVKEKFLDYIYRRSTKGWEVVSCTCEKVNMTLDGFKPQREGRASISHLPFISTICIIDIRTVRTWNRQL